ncbi:MAG: YHYH protein [Acidobacteria bacterium]|nr:YHYH protein [Acidobacteriota bacterium]
MKQPTIFLLLLTATHLIAQPPGGPPPGGGGMQGGDGIWRRNAYYGEIQTLDTCFGHQPGNGDYHYHANPVCLRAQLDDNIELVRTKRTGSAFKEKAAPWKHSPIIGWAFDGYPVYGPYGYSDANSASSAIKRIRSGYRLRQIAERTSIPAWSLANHPGVSQTLTTAQYGAPINAEFPLGRYVEDFEHVVGLGDLDQYNGRFGLTPEYPNGTYAYFVTIAEDGTAAFPYLVGGEFYGTTSGGRAASVPSTATPFTGTPATTPSLTSWATKNSKQEVLVVNSFNPAAGAKTTWPIDIPSGVSIANAVTTPILADTQQIRYTDSTVYINASGLASHVIGPWFDPLMNGGNFSNYPKNQNYQLMFPRTPAPATTKTAAGLGALGLWVNGVAVFNFLDGSSYSVARGTDVGGGAVATTFSNVSSASYEPGPLTAGSLVTATSLFGAVLATGTEATSTAVWPTTLAGATVTVKDSAGTSRLAELLYASPGQINYRVPAESAIGYATVVVAAGGKSYTSNINIAAVYPNLFIANAEEAAAGQVLRSGLDTYLVLYGSGRGSATTATATVGGVAAMVEYAGPQGTFAGLDQYNILVPRSLAGRGKSEVVLTVGGRITNTVNVIIP